MAAAGETFDLVSPENGTRRAGRRDRGRSARVVWHGGSEGCTQAFVPGCRMSTRLRCCKLAAFADLGPTHEEFHPVFQQLDARRRAVVAFQHTWAMPALCCMPDLSKHTSYMAGQGLRASENVLAIAPVSDTLWRPGAVALPRRRRHAVALVKRQRRQRRLGPGRRGGGQLGALCTGPLWMLGGAGGGGCGGGGRASWCFDVPLTGRLWSRAGLPRCRVRLLPQGAAAAHARKWLRLFVRGALSLLTPRQPGQNAPLGAPRGHALIMKPAPSGSGVLTGTSRDRLRAIGGRRP